jgi:hypothetical protein
MKTSKLAYFHDELMKGKEIGEEILNDGGCGRKIASSAHRSIG